MDNFKVVELKSICKGLGLKGYSKLRKKELIEFIEKSQNPNQEEQKEKIIESNEEYECSICLGDKTDEILLNCKHSFCKECINLWEKTNPTCPLCRVKIKRKKRKKNKLNKKEEPYVKVIDFNDYMSEEDFILYMRNLNLNYI